MLTAANPTKARPMAMAVPTFHDDFLPICRGFGLLRLPRIPSMIPCWLEIADGRDPEAGGRSGPDTTSIRITVASARAETQAQYPVARRRRRRNGGRRNENHAGAKRLSVRAPPACASGDALRITSRCR